jgi:dCMP deaminase
MTTNNNTTPDDVNTLIINPFDICISTLKSLEWRPQWSEYFMSVAYLIAKRSACTRLHVGCVITHDNRIVATGYNGYLSGVVHEPVMRDNHDVTIIHAETNAVTDAAKRGVTLKDCIAYVTHIPCVNCAKVLLSAGIKKIVFSEWYKPDALTSVLCLSVNVPLCEYKNGVENNISLITI